VSVRARRVFGGDRGSVAAELAVALPIVLVTALLGVGALTAAARQVALQDAAADAARLLGRGEGAAAASAVVSQAVDGAAFSHERRGDLACATASLDLAIGRFVTVPLRASSCALDGGR